MSSYDQRPVMVSTSTPAIISLICGILGWLGVFGLGGLLAVIFGHVAKNEIRNSGGNVGGGGMATAGLVLGYTNIAVSLAACCLFALMWFGILAAPACLIPFMNNVSPSF